MKELPKCYWKCKECDAKTADLKTVLQSIKEEIGTLKKGQDDLKKGQDDQQTERERVLEGLKVVETVGRKIDQIETVQAEQNERLVAQEEAS